MGTDQPCDFGADLLISSFSKLSRNVLCDIYGDGSALISIVLAKQDSTMDKRIVQYIAPKNSLVFFFCNQIF